MQAIMPYKLVYTVLSLVLLTQQLIRLVLLCNVEYRNIVIFNHFVCSKVVPLFGSKLQLDSMS